MEGIESFHACLKDLQQQAGILAETAVSLGKLFEAEAARISREDGIQLLKALQTEVVEKAKQLKLRESAASYGRTKAILPFSFIELAGVIAAAATKNRRLLEVVHQVFDTSAERKLPYGTVMVVVGPKGLPEDVRIVSISELARESNLSEPQVTQEILKRGCLLFSQEVFSHLIESLVASVREGRLNLPIAVERLAQDEPLKLQSKRVEWLLLPRPE
jgi:hypothetical protein